MKATQVIAGLQRLVDKFGDIDVQAVTEERAPFYFSFYRVVSVSYDKYEREGPFVAEILIEDDDVQEPD